jgi:hypothetical protein
MPNQLSSVTANSSATLLRPTGDISAGSWLDSPLFSKINETTASDSNYIYSQSPVNDTIILGLTAASTPSSRDNHNVRYRIQKSDISGNAIDLTASLYQGNSLISQLTHSDIQYGYFTTGFNLTTAEANNITDYSNLRLNFIGNTTIFYTLMDEITDTFTDENGDYLKFNTDLEISWAEIELYSLSTSVISYSQSISYNYVRPEQVTTNTVVQPTKLPYYNWSR